MVIWFVDYCTAVGYLTTSLWCVTPEANIWQWLVGYKPQVLHTQHKGYLPKVLLSLPLNTSDFYSLVYLCGIDIFDVYIN